LNSFSDETCSPTDGQIWPLVHALREKSWQMHPRWQGDHRSSGNAFDGAHLVGILKLETFTQILSNIW